MGRFVTLDRADGPPCPNCGCRDAEILREATPRPEGWKPDPDVSWWDQQIDTQGRAKCKCCRLEFTFKEVLTEPEEPEMPISEPEAAAVATSAPTVISTQTVPTVACPECGAAMRVTSTRRSVRYHKCPKCGKTSKTAR